MHQWLQRRGWRSLCIGIPVFSQNLQAFLVDRDRSQGTCDKQRNILERPKLSSRERWPLKIRGRREDSWSNQRSNFTRSRDFPGTLKGKDCWSERRVETLWQWRVVGLVDLRRVLDVPAEGKELQLQSRSRRALGKLTVYVGAYEPRLTLSFISQQATSFQPDLRHSVLLAWKHSTAIDALERSWNEPRQQWNVQYSLDHACFPVAQYVERCAEWECLVPSVGLIAWNSSSFRLQPNGVSLNPCLSLTRLIERVQDVWRAPPHALI